MTSNPPSHTPESMWLVHSPHGALTIAFALDGDGAPRFSVRSRDRVVVAASRMGLALRDGGPLERDLGVLDARRQTHDETYDLVAGKARRARDQYHELVVSLGETRPPRRRLDIVFRAYDDGVAFRYVLPPQQGLDGITIVAEATEFHFPANHRCWALELDGFHTSFEGDYRPATLDELTPGRLIGLPLTIQRDDGLALALTEARLTDYAGMYVARAAGVERMLSVTLAPLPDEPAVCVRGALPLSSPWRVLLSGDSPGALIESTVVLNLNDPVALDDTAWIKPGKVAWDWWSGDMVSDVAFEGGMNDATMRHYIAFAAAVGLEYMLIDGGWYGEPNVPAADITRSVPAIDLPGLVRYAGERGVGILVWMHWKDIRDRMEEAFAYYERLGIKGVKVDFFDRDDQEIVRYCRRLIERAAHHRLLVDFHGIYKPTGIERTYPNLMTHEGVMGAEYNKWSARVTPRHNVTLPYTRMLAGPMDYTPGAFHNVTPEAFVARQRAPMAIGTRCHQLAMYVIYESPLQMVSDYPGAYRGQVGAEFLRIVPTTWDETRFLSGAIGEYIALARRHGTDWFVGAMTDASRTLTLPLHFLGDGVYNATVYTDEAHAAMRPTEATTTRMGLTAADTLTLRLAPGGGTAVHFTPDEE